VIGSDWLTGCKIVRRDTRRQSSVSLDNSRYSGYKNSIHLARIPAVICTGWLTRGIPIQSNPMSITEAGLGPLFPSLSKNLKYKNTNRLNYRHDFTIRYTRRTYTIVIYYKYRSQITSVHSCYSTASTKILQFFITKIITTYVNNIEIYTAIYTASLNMYCD